MYHKGCDSQCGSHVIEWAVRCASGDKKGQVPEKRATGFPSSCVKGGLSFHWVS